MYIFIISEPENRHQILHTNNCSRFEYADIPNITLEGTTVKTASFIWLGLKPRSQNTHVMLALTQTETNRAVW